MRGLPDQDLLIRYYSELALDSIPMIAFMPLWGIKPGSPAQNVVGLYLGIFSGGPKALPVKYRCAISQNSGALCSLL